ncbi:MAG TPA: phenylalanine--tRNA ligase subunit beta [Burkholderiales bacterium]|nr:phenylalanine--tRNA ligase subunit beta [Burkholderiales bacterium]
MKFSEDWLRTFVDPSLSARELADMLTFGGIEIEAVMPVAPPFEHVVVGEVLSVVKHPNADRLNVCQVNIGVTPLSIVCGAPNVRTGMRVPVALVGAKLPDLEITAAKVRGVDSQGMLCSARELGLSDAAGELLELPPDAILGADVRNVLELDDQVFDSKPTPNRGDCLSLRGMARDVAALSGTPMKSFNVPTVTVSHADKPVIALDAPAACPRYCGRVIQGVNVKAPTPLWMVQRLARSGVRTISAVVDVTNYVMLELGQPMHAFDAETIEGSIHVRFAYASEPLALLNGETRELSEAFLVIADDKKALALAGIMGGVHSAVCNVTRNILLESAYFSPDVIAGKSRMLGFGSDSSYRFERGVNFAGLQEAMERATRLVLDICGGVAGPVAIAESCTHLPQRAPIALRLSRVERVLGIPFTAEAVASLFTRLGFDHSPVADGLRLTPPPYRFDVSIEEDLIEEVARVHGYNRIPSVLPTVIAAALPATERQRAVPTLRKLLVARDYQEVVTYSFVDRAWECDFCANASPIALANPIASQMAVMRSSLMGGLINSLAYNLHHKQSRVRVFEIGRCFARGIGEGAPGEYQQPWRIGVAACGEAVEDQWGIRPPRPVDFYDVKADVEALFQPGTLTFEAVAHPAFHPGKSARLLCAGKIVGWMGELHPQWQQKYNLSSTPVLFEVELEAAAAQPVPLHKGISKFPPVRRDLAAIFDENTSYQAILDAINAQKPDAVADFAIFDIYRGPGIENGKKSLAFRMLVQDTHKTMTDAEVDSVVSEIIKILQNRFNAKLR